MGWSRVKDPQAVKQYTWDWTDWLSTGETIVTATVTGETGITVSAVSHDDTTVTATLAGGTLGERYAVVCHIVSSAGQEDDDTLTLVVWNQ